MPKSSNVTYETWLSVWHPHKSFCFYGFLYKCHHLVKKYKLKLVNTNQLWYTVFNCFRSFESKYLNLFKTYLILWSWRKLDFWTMKIAEWENPFSVRISYLHSSSWFNSDWHEGGYFYVLCGFVSWILEISFQTFMEVKID